MQTVSGEAPPPSRLAVVILRSGADLHLHLHHRLHLQLFRLRSRELIPFSLAFNPFV
jgi:hypothetical protein